MTNTPAPAAPNAAPPIRVYAVESQPIVALGLEVLLVPGAGFDLLGTSASVPVAREAIRGLRPDIVLLDLACVPGGPRELQDPPAAPEGAPRWVAWASDLGEHDALELIRRGVRGVLLKGMPLHLILQCLRRVHAGGEWLERESMALALSRMLQREAAVPPAEPRLSAREFELARLIATGCPNKVASRQLGLSDGTVRVYLNRIYGKLQVANRVELALYMRARGLMPGC